MRKQCVNKPLILCYCQTTSLLKLPQMLGLLGCGLPLVGAKKKKGAKLEHFLGDPHASPLTPAIWTSFSWACVREGWMGLRCHALAHGHILVLSQ